MRISNKQLEKAFGKKVTPFISVLGIDTASRLGWAKITSDPNSCNIEYGFVDVATTDVYYKYDYMIDFFVNFFKHNTVNQIVIEDTFLKFNVNVLKKLSRYGMVPYVLGKLDKIPRIFISPSESRKYLGLPGNKKKAEVHAAFKAKLDLGIDDEDIVDAIILGLVGILK